MSKKIQKISNLKNIESFLQVNYLKGFKYIDKVGEILNLYQSESGEIAYNMSPERLIIPKPTPEIDEIKISNVDLWCHFTDPKNLGNSERIFLKEAEEILKILEIKKIVRLGWRNYYIHELVSSPSNLNSLTKLSKATTQEMHIRLDMDDGVNSTARVKLLKQREDNKIVLLIDLDVYMEIDIDLIESLHAFTKLKSSIESQEILEMINEIVSQI